MGHRIPLNHGRLGSGNLMGIYPKRYQKHSGFRNHTLPETNSSHLKIDPWKRRFLLETTIFRGYLVGGMDNLPSKLVDLRHGSYTIPSLQGLSAGAALIFTYFNQWFHVISWASKVLTNVCFAGGITRIRWVRISTRAAMPSILSHRWIPSWDSIQFASNFPMFLLIL